MSSRVSICALLAISAVAATLSSPARAELHAAERLEPGELPAMPGKGPLPRREGALALTVGGGALLGDGSGGEAFASMRLAEAIGVGGGVMVTGDGTMAFLRFDALGLAINHWVVLGYADLVFGEGWRFGGAVVVPVRRDSYLRLSAASNLDDGASFGIGLEHDLW